MLFPPSLNVGDQLLLTAVARELKSRNPSIKVWKTTQFPGLFQGNPDFACVRGAGWEIIHYSRLYQAVKMDLRGVEFLGPDIEVPPERHIIAEFCTGAGVQGQVALRPYMYLTEAEKAKGRLAPRQVLVHNNTTGMRNKLWFPERMQHVVEELARRSERGAPFSIMQVGPPTDPPLSGVIDLRGKTSLRETAAILSQADVLIDTVNGLMHMARAVECRSVIIYGGRERAWQSGYSCNQNLESMVECSPCWRYNGCEFGRKCMAEITAEQVVDATERVISLRGQPLEVDYADVKV